MKRSGKKRSSRSTRKPTRTAMARSLTRTQKAEVTALVKGSQRTNLAVQQLIAPQTSFTQGITSVAEFYSCLPSMIEGTDEGTMIGARIMPSSLVVDFAFNLPYGDAPALDITAHLFCLTQNNIKSFNEVGSMTHLFLRDPTVASPGNVTAFTGGFQNAMIPVDTRAFKVLAHKKIHLKKGAGVTNEASLGTAVVCPGQVIKHLRVKIKCPKVLKYEQTASSTLPYPSNFNPIWCLGWVYNDDTSVGSSQHVEVTAVASLKYKNA